MSAQSVAFRALAVALTDVAFDRGRRAENSRDEETCREALSQALLFKGFARALHAAAIAMEAATAGETGTGSTRSATARASSEASPGKDNHA